MRPVTNHQSGGAASARTDSVEVTNERPTVRGVDELKEKRGQNASNDLWFYSTLSRFTPVLLMVSPRGNKE